jgi:hypothetical protein
MHAELIPISQLRAGDVLRQSLFTRHGIKLLPRGARVTEGVLKALRHSGEPLLVLADSVADLASARLVRRVRPVRIGRGAPTPAVTIGGRLPLEAGQPVEEHHRDAFELGAFEPASPDPEEDPSALPRRWAIRHEHLNRVRTAMLRVADEQVHERAVRWDALDRSVPVGVDAPRLPAEYAAGWASESALADLRRARVQVLRGVYARLVAGLPVSLEHPRAVVEDLLERLESNPRRFAGLALVGSAGGADTLPEHAFAAGALALGIAARLRWPRAMVAEAALAGLLADAGMAMVPSAVRLRPGGLDEAEVNRVRRHPTWSVVLLEAVRDLPERVLCAVHQHHERENGRGYPRGLRGERIHPIARVLAVADVFAALTAHRPRRPALTPFRAMEQVRSMVSQGLLHRPAVRALMDLCGLFPVSSVVRLSDGTLARVIGAHESLHDRPLIQRLHDGRAGPVVDLSTVEPGELSIVEAVPDDAVMTAH